MLVARHGLTHVEDSPPALTQAPGQVRVLVVHEQVLAKASQGLPRLTPNRAGASAQAEDLTGGVLSIGGHQPVPVIAVAGGVHQVARGVDQDLPLAAGSGLVIESGPPPGAGETSASGCPGAAGVQRPASRIRAVAAAGATADGGSLRAARSASRKPGSATASLLSRTRTSSTMPRAPRLTPAPKPRFSLDSTTVSSSRRSLSAEPSPEALSTMTSTSSPPSCSRMERAARIVSSAWRQLTTTTRAEGRLTGWVTPHPRSGRDRPPCARRRRPPR